MTARALNYLLYRLDGLPASSARRGVMMGGCVPRLLVVAAHLTLARRRRDELDLALWTAAIGVAVDTTQIGARHAALDAGTLVAWLPPPWLVVIWMQFAMTFHYSLRWLNGRPSRAALFGGLGGPLAFYAGRRLGIVDLHPRPVAEPRVPCRAVEHRMPASMWLSERQSRRDGAGEYRWPAGPAPRATASAEPVGANGLVDLKRFRYGTMERLAWRSRHAGDVVHAARL